MQSDTGGYTVSTVVRIRTLKLLTQKALPILNSFVIA